MKATIFILVGLVLYGCKKESNEDYSKSRVSEKSEIMKKADNFFKSISTVKLVSIPKV